MWNRFKCKTVNWRRRALLLLSPNSCDYNGRNISYWALRSLSWPDGVRTHNRSSKYRHYNSETYGPIYEEVRLVPNRGIWPQGWAKAKLAKPFRAYSCKSRLIMMHCLVHCAHSFVCDLQNSCRATLKQSLFDPQVTEATARGEAGATAPNPAARVHTTEPARAPTHPQAPAARTARGWDLPGRMANATEENAQVMFLSIYNTSE